MMEFDAKRRNFLGGVVGLAAFAKSQSPFAGDLDSLQTELVRAGHVVLDRDYFIDRTLVMPPNSTIESKGNRHSIISVSDIVSPTGNHRHMVWMADRCTLRNVNLNGSHYICGGIYINRAKDFCIEDISVANCINYKNSKIYTQAIEIEGSDSGFIHNCCLKQSWHGIQVWQSRNINITACKVEEVLGGGIWTADSDSVYINNCTISDCGDVGIDFEGGIDCVAANCRIRSCRYGEIAVFKNALNSSKGCHNLKFIGCHAVRTPSYKSWTGTSLPCSIEHGAFDISSLSDSSTGIRVLNCRLDVFSGFAVGIHEIGSTHQEILIKDCEIQIPKKEDICNIELHDQELMQDNEVVVYERR